MSEGADVDAARVFCRQSGLDSSWVQPIALEFAAVRAEGREELELVDRRLRVALAELVQEGPLSTGAAIAVEEIQWAIRALKAKPAEEE